MDNTSQFEEWLQSLEHRYGANVPILESLWHSRLGAFPVPDRSHFLRWLAMVNDVDAVA